MLAENTLRYFIDKASRLYEREREDPSGSSAIGTYVRRWNGWVKSGVGDLSLLMPLCLVTLTPEPCGTGQSHPE